MGFKTLLRFLYGGLPEESECEVWMELLTAADKYDISKLKEICETSIARDLRVGNVIDVLLLAETLNCHKLLGRATDFFKVHIDSLASEGDNWRKLRTNPDLLAKLFQRCTK